MILSVLIYFVSFIIMLLEIVINIRKDIMISLVNLKIFIIIYSNKLNLLDYIIIKEKHDILKLDFNSQRIIILYYFYNYNFRKISYILNLSYCHTLKCKKNALILLKDILNNFNYNFLIKFFILHFLMILSYLFFLSYDDL